MIDVVIDNSKCSDVAPLFVLLNIEIVYAVPGLRLSMVYVVARPRDWWPKT